MSGFSGGGAIRYNLDHPPVFYIWRSERLLRRSSRSRLDEARYLLLCRIQIGELLRLVLIQFAEARFQKPLPRVILMQVGQPGQDGKQSFLRENEDALTINTGNANWLKM